MVCIKNKFGKVVHRHHWTTKRPMAKDRLITFTKTDFNDHPQTAGHSILSFPLPGRLLLHALPHPSRYSPDITISIRLFLISLVNINLSSFTSPQNCCLHSYQNLSFILISCFLLCLCFQGINFLGTEIIILRFNIEYKITVVGNVVLYIDTLEFTETCFMVWYMTNFCKCSIYTQKRGII